MKIGYLETIIEKKGRDEREGREMALVLSLRVNGGVLRMIKGWMRGGC